MFYKNDDETRYFDSYLFMGKIIHNFDPYSLLGPENGLRNDVIGGGFVCQRGNYLCNMTYGA